jgi:hypothetical protein
MLQDCQAYKELVRFRPKRFLETDPVPLLVERGQFGFGRRMCPGKMFADQSGWLLIAQAISMFDIVHKDNENRFKIVPAEEGRPDLVHHPKTYVMDLKPRNAKHAAMLGDLEKTMSWERDDAMI